MYILFVLCFALLHEHEERKKKAFLRDVLFTHTPTHLACSLIYSQSLMSYYPIPLLSSPPSPCCHAFLIQLFFSFSFLISLRIPYYPHLRTCSRLHLTLRPSFLFFFLFLPSSFTLHPFLVLICTSFCISPCMQMNACFPSLLSFRFLSFFFFFISILLPSPWCATGGSFCLFSSLLLSIHFPRTISFSSPVSRPPFDHFVHFFFSSASFLT
ncbi:MAG: hypothetical protein JOS17DRAFT_249773 [Linnemannia elongata]|nr:MAG: hypothetical protein JOS17DRAFT_249773 [Linnemannia elongata]